MLSAVAKIAAQIILERTREDLKSLIYTEQLGFRSGFSNIHNVNILGVILEQFSVSFVLHKTSPVRFLHVIGDVLHASLSEV